jgi:hypothetical protein
MPAERANDGISNWSQRSEHKLIAATVDRVVIMPRSIEVHLAESSTDQPEKVISIGWVKPSNHRRKVVLTPKDNGNDGRRVITADAQAPLVEAIARARKWLDEISSRKVDSIETIAMREGRSERSIRMTLSLAFLAPDIIQAVVRGVLPRGIGLSCLVDMPMDWTSQRDEFNLGSDPVVCR